MGMGRARMTDEAEGTVEAARPASRAAKLEAKAARLREREEAKALAAQERAEARRTAADSAGSDPVGPAAASTPSRAWMVSALVAGILLVAMLAVGLPLLLSTSHTSSSRAHSLAAERRLDADRQVVISDATQCAIDFGSYDYQHLSADFQKVSAHLTPDFAKSYSTITAQLAPPIVDDKAKSTAQVQGIAVSAISTSSATVLVFLDQTVTTSQSSTSRIDRNRLTMTLQRQGNGAWLVSDIRLV
jgi:Mce-associated membrane protein